MGALSFAFDTIIVGALALPWLVLAVVDYAPSSKIYTLDPGTGMTTAILETHLDFVNNIAFKQTP
jgi:hypothetical protein